MKIEIDRLKEKLHKILSLYDKKERDLITESILFAEMSGKKSHGINKLRTPAKDSFILNKPERNPEIKRTSTNSSLINANNNSGMLIINLAANELIEKMKSRPVYLVGANSSFSSSGCLGFVNYKIAKAGFISIVMAQSPATTAIHGGYEPMFGTNPIGFGFPTKNDPLIFDMGTSAISWGEILRRNILGEDLPPKTALDANGNETTNTKEALEGTTLPFDNSYKGSGLAMMIEILAGLITGASFTNKNESGGWGNLLIGIDPNIFFSKKIYFQRIHDMIDEMKASKPRKGMEVRLPGEVSLKKYKTSVSEGTVEIDENILNDVNEIMKK